MTGRPSTDPDGLGDAGESQLGDTLRSHGKRLTGPRRRIVAALGRLAHATPDQLVVALAEDGDDPVPASTVYRGLEALEGLGVVTHTHLDHRAPTYQLAQHDDHIHLVCRVCGEIDEVPAASAGELVGNLRAVKGFEADMTHMAIHGTCARCGGAR